MMESEPYAASFADPGNPQDAQAWDAFVASCEHAVNYHRSKWLNIVRTVFGHAVLPLWARDDAGRVHGVLPLVHMRSRLFGNGLHSLPFFNYGGVLATDAQAAAVLLRKASDLMTETCVPQVELRNLGWSHDALPARTHKVTMRLPLPGHAETLWKGFSAKVRNQVRKAEKSGLTFSMAGPERLHEFYAVFARNMRDLGTPVYTRKLFSAVLEHCADESALFLVHLNDQCVAAGLGLWHRGVFEIPWASSVRDYNSMCSNHLLYWGMLRTACGLGCSIFDFGRSTPDSGTYRFKKQWGAEPVQLYWQYLLAPGASLPETTPDNPRYDLPIRIWKRLPVALTRIVGPGIVRCIP